MPGELTPLSATLALLCHHLGPAGAAQISLPVPSPAQTGPVSHGGVTGQAWPEVAQKQEQVGGNQWLNGFGAQNMDLESELLFRQQENPCPARLGPAGALNTQNQGTPWVHVSQMSLQSLPCPGAQPVSVPGSTGCSSGGTFPEKIRKQPHPDTFPHLFRLKLWKVSFVGWKGCDQATGSFKDQCSDPA